MVAWRLLLRNAEDAAFLPTGCCVLAQSEDTVLVRGLRRSSRPSWKSAQLSPSLAALTLPVEAAVPCDGAVAASSVWSLAPCSPETAS